MRSNLKVLNKKLGLDLCGEGGEYETLVLDCDAFKSKRLFINASEVKLNYICMQLCMNF